MTTWTRVKDKHTGHHYSVAVVNPKHHEVLKQDAVDRHGKPLPAKHNINAAKAPDTSDKKSADTPKES